MPQFLKNITYGQSLALKDMVDYLPGQVVSKTLAQNPSFGMTLFAIPQGEGISAHRSSGDAFVYLLEGIAQVTIDETNHNLEAGQCIVLPSGRPHALQALQSFKMLLVVAFQ